MGDTAYCEPAADILAAARAKGFSLKERQLADWHRNGLLPQPKKVGLGRGRGTVTCYPRGATRQAYDLLRLRNEYGRRNFGMIGWMLSMRGYDVDPRYWKGPVTDAVNDWYKILQFTEKDDDGIAQISDRFFNSLSGIPRTTLNRTALGVFLKRLRLDNRETFLVTLMRVRLGNPAIVDSWDSQAKQVDLDIIGLATGLQQPRKKIRVPFEWENRIIDTQGFTFELNRLSDKVSRVDLSSYVANLSDTELLFDLRRFSRFWWITISTLSANEHRFAKSALTVSVTDKPRHHALAAILGAIYFDFSDPREAVDA